MKVYVVIDDQIEANVTKAVFSTRALAKKYIKEHKHEMDTGTVHEFEVDGEK